MLAIVLLGAVGHSWAGCTGKPALEANVAANPTAHAYQELGAWFNDQKQYDCAVGPLKRSVALDPKAIQSHVDLAQALDQLQHHDEAKAEWKAALRLNPASTVALVGLGRSLNATEDYFSTINLLRNVPHTEDVSLVLAYAYVNVDKLDEADKILAAALRTAPSSERLIKAQSKVLVHEGRSIDATQLLKNFTLQHPHNAEILHMYLGILVMTGDQPQARPLAAKLLTMIPHDADVLYLAGVLENADAKYPAARDHLTESVALNPNSYDSRYNLGLALAALEDYPAAREQTEKAVALDPNQPKAHYLLGTILRALGETQLAKQQFTLSQQQLHAKEAQVIADASAKEAAQKLAAGDVTQAIALYREAVQATPQDAELLYHLSLAQDRAGDSDGERATLEQVLAIQPRLAIAQNQLGYLMSLRGDPAEAEKHFQLAVDAAPAYADAWINLAATLGMELRLPEARRAIAQAVQLDPGNKQAKQLQHELDAAQ